MRTQRTAGAVPAPAPLPPHVPYLYGDRGGWQQTSQHPRVIAWREKLRAARDVYAIGELCRMTYAEVTGAVRRPGRTVLDLDEPRETGGAS